MVTQAGITKPFGRVILQPFQATRCKIGRGPHTGAVGQDFKRHFTGLEAYRGTTIAHADHGEHFAADLVDIRIAPLHDMSAVGQGVAKLVHFVARHDISLGGSQRQWNTDSNNVMSTPRETDLYPPVKSFLEDQGYVVKAEVGAADVVAIRGEEPPVVVELKLVFSLALFHQCVERLKVSDDVYLAVAHKPGKPFYKAVKANTVLARRLGLGLMTVRLSDGLVSVHCDPGPYAPRKNTKRKASLLREFARRQGDPNDGGQTRVGLITAYRQDALKLAIYLFEVGASKGADVARETEVKRATVMMRDNHYGWFEKVEKGIYGISPEGAEAVKTSGRVLGSS